MLLVSSQKNVSRESKIFLYEQEKVSVWAAAAAEGECLGDAVTIT